MKSKGYTVYEEPPIVTNSGLQKPDIVAIKDVESLVIDAQVVTDSIGLEYAHNTKFEKYNNTNLPDVVSRVFECDRPRVLTCTLNWRGVLGKTSIDQLLGKKVIAVADLKILSTRALIGGIATFNNIGKDTPLWRRRPPRHT